MLTISSTSPTEIKTSDNKLLKFNNNLQKNKLVGKSMVSSPLFGDYNIINIQQHNVQSFI